MKVRRLILLLLIMQLYKFIKHTYFIYAGSVFFGDTILLINSLFIVFSCDHLAFYLNQSLNLLSRCDPDEAQKVLHVVWINCPKTCLVKYSYTAIFDCYLLTDLLDFYLLSCHFHIFFVNG